MLNKIVVCGVGLIGGSFALGLKAAGKVNEVLGLGRTRGPLEEAWRLGVIDRIADGWADALAGADLVLLATPVGQMEAVFAALAHLILLPVRSSPMAAAPNPTWSQRHVPGLAARSAQFMSRSSDRRRRKKWRGAARPDLYVDKRVVLTPLAENSAGDVAKVQAAWEACGARVSRLASEEHDRVFAAVSHLPHLLAFALVHDFAQRPNSDQLFGFAAGGFRDFTRIASSHPEMWRDICVANRHALLQELDAYMLELMRTRVLLAAADAMDWSNCSPPPAPGVTPGSIHCCRRGSDGQH
jgi:prephenate dehydrogenase